MKAKKHLPLLLLALVLLWGLWYARPLDIYGLEPGLVPQSISIRLTSYQGWDMEEDVRTVELHAGDPAFEELLTQLETLRFRRSPTDFLRDLISVGTPLGEGSYSISLWLRSESTAIQLLYWYDHWLCLPFDSADYERVSLVNDTEYTDTLYRDLLEISLPEPESP